MISISVTADKYSRNVLSVLYMQISFMTNIIPRAKALGMILVSRVDYRMWYWKSHIIFSIYQILNGTCTKDMNIWVKHIMRTVQWLSGNKVEERCCYCCCTSHSYQCCLTHGHAGKLPRAHEHRSPMLFYVCCVQHVFLMFKHWFCWK
jgi:hypothetical protein